MKRILFDLDGTLVDTLEDIRAALNHVMALCWCREISASECRAVVGNGLRKALIGALWYSRAAYPEDELDILYRELVDFYSANACVHSRVYDGIPELLDEAKGRGCMLGVLSNKADSLVQEIIGRLLPGRFDFVRGLREGERPKPDKKGVEDFIELCKAKGFSDKDISKRYLSERFSDLFNEGGEDKAFEIFSRITPNDCQAMHNDKGNLIEEKVIEQFKLIEDRIA